MKLLVTAMLLGAVGLAFGKEVTTCRAPAGKVFFHYAGDSAKDQAGWHDDKISKGVFTLTRVGKDVFDVLYLDTRGKPISSTQDGGVVRLLRRGSDSITVLVYYPTSATEIYSFFKEKDGRNRFTLLQSRTGDEVAFPKSSLLVGECDEISFQ